MVNVGDEDVLVKVRAASVNRARARPQRGGFGKIVVTVS